jgi:hypothetical protein
MSRLGLSDPLQLKEIITHHPPCTPPPMNKSGFLLRQRSAIKTWTSSFFEIDPVSHSLRQYDAGRPATGMLSSVGGRPGLIHWNNYN